MSLRKILKSVLPYGVVDLFRNRRELARLGRKLRPNEWWRSDWLMHEAQCTGLDLFAKGYAADLKYVVDIGANTGQWSGMLLDLVSPKQLIVVEPGPEAFAQLRER